jgi:hypothetical protein
MRSFMRILSVVLFSLAVFFVVTPRAEAVKAFKDEFEVVYVKADSKAPNDVALTAAVKEAKCAVCHMPETKKKRNAYGQELGKLLDRKKDAENKQKIREALEKVAAAKCNPKDPKSPTFGDLIRAGKLPCPKAK